VLRDENRSMLPRGIFCVRADIVGELCNGG